MDLATYNRFMLLAQLTANGASGTTPGKNLETPPARKRVRNRPSTAKPREWQHNVIGQTGVVAATEGGTKFLA